MVLNVGDLAPNFELPDTELKMRTLEEFKGKKIVLSFIVAESSPVCEVELCTFRDSWKEISDMGAQIISISNDGPFANKAFAEKHNFNFPLLGDYTSKTIKEYDILLKDLLHIKDYNAAKHSVFIIIEDGKIGYKWVSEDPLKDYEVSRNELGEHNKELLNKEEYIFLSKTDLIDQKRIKELVSLFKKKKKEVIPISIIDDNSMEEVKKILNKIMDQKLGKN